MTSTITQPGGGLSRRVREWTLAIGVVSAAMGIWGFFFPETFFEEFPILGANWVSNLGPYNEHLMRDFGSAQLGLGVVAVLVAVARSFVGTRSVLIGFMVFGVLHLAYHIGTLGLFSPASAVSQALALATFVVIPAVLVKVMSANKKGKES